VDCPPEDVDGFLNRERKVRGACQQHSARNADTLACFFNFLTSRYQDEIHQLTGHMVTQPYDKFNRPAKPDYGGMIPAPPSGDEVEALFSGWREALLASCRYLRHQGLSRGVAVAPGLAEDRRNGHA
jgi:hypothetical protein